MGQIELENRFTKMSAEILAELKERDTDIGTAESKPLPGDNSLRPEALAERKQARVKEAVRIKMNSKTRLTGQVADFLKSLHVEGERRRYPLASSTNPENIRRSEYLDTRARVFVESIGADASKLATEIASNSEPEYESRLHAWVAVFEPFTGKEIQAHDHLSGSTPAVEIYSPLLKAWRDRLELPALDTLIRRVANLQAEMKRSYFLSERFQNRKPLDFFEWERREREFNGEVSPSLIPDLH